MCQVITADVDLLDLPVCLILDTRSLSEMLAGAWAGPEYRIKRPGYQQKQQDSGHDVLQLVLFMNIVISSYKQLIVTLSPFLVNFNPLNTTT